MLKLIMALAQCVTVICMSIWASITIIQGARADDDSKIFHGFVVMLLVAILNGQGESNASSS